MSLFMFPSVHFSKFGAFHAHFRAKEIAAQHHDEHADLTEK